MRLNRKAILLTVVTLLAAGCARSDFRVSHRDRETWLPVSNATIAKASEAKAPKVLPGTHYAAARLFESQGLFDKAINQYRKAVAVNHSFVDAYHRMGLILSITGRHQEALAALSRAVELKPDNPALRNNLGFELLLAKRWMDAERELRSATELRPGFARAHVNLGMALSKLGRFDDALASFRAVLPEADAYYNLGLMYRGQRMYDNAADTFRHVLSVNPDFTAARTQLEQMASQMEPDETSHVQAQEIAMETNFQAQTPTTPDAAARATYTLPEAVEPIEQLPVCFEPVLVADVPEETVWTPEPCDDPNWFAEPLIDDGSFDEFVALVDGFLTPADTAASDTSIFSNDQAFAPMCSGSEASGYGLQFTRGEMDVAATVDPAVDMPDGSRQGRPTMAMEIRPEDEVWIEEEPCTEEELWFDEEPCDGEEDFLPDAAHEATDNGSDPYDTGSDPQEDEPAAALDRPAGRSEPCNEDVSVADPGVRHPAFSGGPSVAGEFTEFAAEGWGSLGDIEEDTTCLVGPADGATQMLDASTEALESVTCATNHWGALQELEDRLSILRNEIACLEELDDEAAEAVALAKQEEAQRLASLTTRRVDVGPGPLFPTEFVKPMGPSARLARVQPATTMSRPPARQHERKARLVADRETTHPAKANSTKRNVRQAGERREKPATPQQPAGTKQRTENLPQSETKSSGQPLTWRAPFERLEGLLEITRNEIECWRDAELETTDTGGAPGEVCTVPMGWPITFYDVGVQSVSHCPLTETCGVATGQAMRERADTRRTIDARDTYPDLHGAFGHHIDPLPN